MLRKKKSLIDRAVDSASDAVDAALPVIENAMTHGARAGPRAEQGRRGRCHGPRQGHQDQGRPAHRRDQGAGRERSPRHAEVAIPKAKTPLPRGPPAPRSLAASGKEIAAAKVAEVKGEPPKKKGSKFRKLLVFGSLAAAAGFVLQQDAAQVGGRQLAVVVHPAGLGRLDELDHQRHHGRPHRRPAARTWRRVSAPTSRSPPTTRWPSSADEAAPATTPAAPPPTRRSPTPSRSRTSHHARRPRRRRRGGGARRPRRSSPAPC